MSGRDSKKVPKNRKPTSSSSRKKVVKKKVPSASKKKKVVKKSLYKKPTVAKKPTPAVRRGGKKKIQSCAKASATKKKVVSKKVIKKKILKVDEPETFLLLRLRGRDGTFRFNWSSNQKFKAVSEFLEGRTGVPLNEFSFFLDQTCKQHLKSRKELKAGSLVFYDYDKTSFESKQAKKHRVDKEEREKFKEGNINNLGLGAKKRQWTLGELEKEISSNLYTLKAEKYPKVCCVNVDHNSGQIFQQLLKGMAFQMHRCGYLIGTERKGRWAHKKKKKTEEEAEGEESDDEKKEKPEEDDDDEADAWSKKISKVLSGGKNIVRFDSSLNKKVSSESYYLNVKEPEGGFKELFVDAIYEPPQFHNPSDNKVVELEDKIIDELEIMLKYLNMKRIGYIFTYYPSKNKRGPFIFKNTEVIKMAEDQIEHGPGFVTIACGMDKKRQVCQFDAYQATTHCMELVKKGLLKPHPTDPKKFKVTKPIGFNRAHVEEIDVFLCIVKVPIKDYTSKVFEFGFPVRNREDIDIGFKQDMGKVKGLIKGKKMGRKFHKQINDFHLLVYLVLEKNIFVLKNDFPVIAKGLLNDSDRGIQGYRDILNMYMGN